MEDHPPDSGEVPDQASVVSDEFLVNVVLVSPGEDLSVSKQVAISKTLFRQSPAHGVSQIFPQISKKFSPKEQRQLEHRLCLSSWTIRTNDPKPIYFNIIIVNTATEVDGEERVMIFREDPCKGVDGQLIFLKKYFAMRIRQLGYTKLRIICRINEVVRKYGDSMQCEEVKDVTDDCSVCLGGYEIGSQAIRLPCRHFFCTTCTLLWLDRNASCPLCRYQLIPESHSTRAS